MVPALEGVSKHFSSSGRVGLSLSLEEIIAAVGARARKLSSRGVALGAFDAPPPCLNVERLHAMPARTLATVANRALSPRGVSESNVSAALLGGIFSNGSGAPTERAVIDAAVAGAVAGDG